jgi:hypothetical protein
MPFKRIQLRWNGTIKPRLIEAPTFQPQAPLAAPIALAEATAKLKLLTTIIANNATARVFFISIILSDFFQKISGKAE